MALNEKDNQAIEQLAAEKLGQAEQSVVDAVNQQQVAAGDPNVAGKT